jgi:hypothetical protein
LLNTWARPRSRREERFRPLSTHIDVILLDLTLPDSRGPKTLVLPLEETTLKPPEAGVENVTTFA